MSVAGSVITIATKTTIIIFYEEGLLSDCCPHCCMFTPLVVCHDGTLLLAASECVVWSLGGGGGEHGPHALRDGQGHAIPTEVSTMSELPLRVADLT